MIVVLGTALVISFVGYMESIAVAKSLASKRRQKVSANQELLALGAANLGVMFTGGYPVTGAFSRSVVVNYEAGANSGLASIITAVNFIDLEIGPICWIVIVYDSGKLVQSCRESLQPCFDHSARSLIH